MAELVARHGFHTSAYLLTDLNLAPWIEFRTVAAVSEQENQYEFFVARL